MPSIVPHNCAAHEYRHAYHKRCDELFAEHAQKLARMGFFERRRFRNQLREPAAFELKTAAVASKLSKPPGGGCFSSSPLIH